MRMSRLLPLAFVLAALLAPMKALAADAATPVEFLHMIRTVVAMGDLRQGRDVERLLGATFKPAQPVTGRRFTDDARPAAPWSVDYRVWQYGVSLRLNPDMAGLCVTLGDVVAAFGGGFERYSGRLMNSDGSEAAVERDHDLFALRYSVTASPPPTYVHFVFHYRRCLVEVGLYGGQQAHPVIDR